jgi:hypothetical protein
VLVYLFRNEGRPPTVAYSTDVTGRNLPRQMPGTSWAFVTAASHQEISEGEAAICHLRRHGFYSITRGRPPKARLPFPLLLRGTRLPWSRFPDR